VQGYAPFPKQAFLCGHRRGKGIYTGFYRQWDYGCINEGKELFEVLWTDWLEHHLLTPVLGTPVAELDYDMLYEILPP